MPQLRNWIATTTDGREVSREAAPSRLVPSDALALVVDTDCMARVRAVVKAGERLRVFTRRTQEIAIASSEIVGGESIPCVELTTEHGDTVRLFAKGNEFLLTTADDHRG
jgi:hypothetical protein